MTRHIRVRGLGRLSPSGELFVSIEALSGIVLLLATAAALVWANVASGSYDGFVEYQGWINDGLMTVFFFVVGLEIKREFVSGELRDRRAALVPIVAAAGGMIVPACIYFAFNAGGATKGWGIPIATDIALAVGVLSLLGGIVPSALRLFVLTFAIVDDIGAIAVIAIFYSHGSEPVWFAGAAACIAAVLVMNRLRIPLAVYLVPAAALWVCIHESGVHATIAGVLLALLLPAERLEEPLHVVSSFVIVPLFALANAGIVLTRDALSDATSSRIALGIFFGLVVGKFVGVWGATALTVRLGWGRLPSAIRLRHIATAAALAGIGFTVSLFVADLSFEDEQLAIAKIAILGASITAGILGAVVSLFVRNRPSAGRIPHKPV